MKPHRETRTLHLPARMDFVNVTGDVEAAPGRREAREGLGTGLPPCP